MPGTDHCPVCAAVDQYSRQLAEEDKQARAQLPQGASPRTPLPSDGVSVIVRRLTPGEVEEIREQRDAARPPGRAPRRT